MESTVHNASPVISVIMPSYNTAHLIADSLDSVLKQVFSRVEIIVVNDGSPDTSDLEEILAPYLKKIVYIKQANKGAAGARNTAIRRARGEFLAFLDSDDIWFPDHLSAQMKLFEENPALDMVYCNCLTTADSPRASEFMNWCPSEGPATFLALAVERCQIPVSTVVVRKRTLVDSGLFDEGLARCDDYDMWLRAAFNGAKIGYSRKVQVRLNGGRPGSLGESRARMAEACWKILQKTEETLPLTFSDRAVIRKRITEIHGKYLLEEGKIRLQKGELDEAKKLISEANSYLKKPKLALVLLCLNVAPASASKLAAVVTKIRNAQYGL